MEDKYLVLIDLDGCKPEILYELIQKKELPAFSEITDGGTFIDNGVTIFPSDTMPAQVSLVTGCYPAKHKVYKNMWFDRTAKDIKLRAYTDDMWDASRVYGYNPYGPFPEFVMPKWKGGFLLNNDLNPEVKTIYEVLKERSITNTVFLHQVSKGTDYYYPPDKKSSLKFILQDKILKTGKFGFLTEYLVDTAIHHINGKGLPEFTFIYFGETDGHSHKHGTESLRNFLKHKIDKELGRLIKLLKSKKLLDKLNFIITADHSQAECKKGKWKISNETTFKTLLGKFEKDRKVLVNKFSEEAEIIITRGISTFIYIKNSKTRLWKDEPTFKTDVLPIVEEIHKNNLTNKDGQYLNLIIVWNPDEKIHCVFDKNHGIIPASEYFKDIGNKYPLASERLAGIGNSISGNIILFSNYEEGFILVNKLEYGEHGSLSIEDSKIPLIFSGSELSGKIIKTKNPDYCKIIDIAPTVASFFGCTMPTADGKALI